MENYVKLFMIFAFSFGLVIGIIIGYAWGFTSGLNWMFDKAVYFLRLQGLEFNVDTATLTSLFMSYRDRVDDMNFDELFKNGTNKALSFNAT